MNLQPESGHQTWTRAVRDQSGSRFESAPAIQHRDSNRLFGENSESQFKVVLLQDSSQVSELTIRSIPPRVVGHTL